MADRIHTLSGEQASRFRTEGRVDPLTKQGFSAGDRVVACGHCGVVWKSDTWVGIARCECGSDKITAWTLPNGADSLQLDLRRRRSTENQATPLNRPETVPRNHIGSNLPPHEARKDGFAFILIVLIVLGLFGALTNRSETGMPDQPSPPVTPAPPARPAPASRIPHFVPGLMFEFMLKNTQWEQIQKALVARGVADLRITSVPDEVTRNAILLYQKKTNLKPTGYLTHRQVLGLVGLSFESPNRNPGVEICNRTNFPARIWLGIGSRSLLNLRDAVVIEKSGCSFVYQSAVNERIWLYAEAGNLTIADNDAIMVCVGARQAEIVKSSACTNAQGSLRRYQEIEFGSTDGVKVNLFASGQ